jgi:hypothetical protein
VFFGWKEHKGIGGKDKFKKRLEEYKEVEIEQDLVDLA